MLNLNRKSDLSTWIRDQGFNYLVIKTQDGERVGTIEHDNIDTFTNSVAAWLDNMPGTYELRFKKGKTDRYDYAALWKPGQDGAGILNGLSDPASLKSQILAELKAEQEREAEREELNRLKTINGQLGAVFETVLPGLIQYAAKYFNGGQNAPAANLQGIDIDNLPQDQQDITERAIGRLLRHVSPDFLMSLANYVEQHPDIVIMVGQLIGHQEAPDFSVKKNQTNDQNNTE